MRPSLIALLVLLGPSIASAQEDPAANEPPDLRVQVSLRNGSSIVGIAPGGCLLERQTRKGYEPVTSAEDRHCGVRIWYYRNLDGFIFLPDASVAELKVLSALPPAESKALREAAARARQDAVRPSRGEGRDPTRRRGEPGDAVALSEAESTLLQEFPPASGWSATRFGEIQRRRIVDGKAPEPAEARFVEVFDAWSVAAKKAEAGATAGPEAGPAGGRPVKPSERKDAPAPLPGG